MAGNLHNQQDHSAARNHQLQYMITQQEAQQAFQWPQQPGVSQNEHQSVVAPQQRHQQYNAAAQIPQNHNGAFPQHQQHQQAIARQRQQTLAAEHRAQQYRINCPFRPLGVTGERTTR